MAFTYDPTTSRGQVRRLVGDVDATNTANQLFSDAEIDAFLALEGGDVYAAAATACEAAAGDLNRDAQAFDRKTVEQFLAMADRYRKRATEGAVVEEIDQADHRIDRFGRDQSEYVGDITT